jgi:hypothetical protein
VPVLYLREPLEPVLPKRRSFSEGLRVDQVPPEETLAEPPPKPQVAPGALRAVTITP